MQLHKSAGSSLGTGAVSSPAPVLTAPTVLPRGVMVETTSSWSGRTPVVACTMARDKTSAHRHLNISKLDQLLQLTPAESPEHSSTATKARQQTQTRPRQGSRHVPLRGSESGTATEQQEPIYKPVLSVPFPPAVAGSQQLEEEQYNPSNGWRRQPHHLTKAELWRRIRDEAQMDAELEPSLATFLHSVILSHSSMEAAMAFLLANKLADNLMLGSVQLMSLIRDVYAADPSILEASMADMQAVLDRDPACAKYTQCMLHFKGYQAIQAHRITHYLWNQGRQTLALAIQARVSELFAVDIHPGAVLGRGVMFDHATGIVIGETAVVGDNVSLLHHVSLGGSGTGRRARHPHIGHGVLLGAGVAVLGPVLVGAGSKVGAGSVVVTDLPSHCVAVGVPARIVRRNLQSEPVREMDQCTDFVYDYVI